MKRTVLFLIALCAFSSTASASLSIKEYKSAKGIGQGIWETVQAYITGAGNAFVVANTVLKSERLYCQPNTLALDASNYVHLIDRQIQDGKTKDDSDITIVLYFALQETFPCPK